MSAYWWPLNLITLRGCVSIHTFITLRFSVVWRVFAPRLCIRANYIELNRTNITFIQLFFLIFLL